MDQIFKKIIFEIGNNHLGDIKYFDQYIDLLIKKDVKNVSFQIREEEFYKDNNNLILNKNLLIDGFEKLRKNKIKIGYAVSDTNYKKYVGEYTPDFFKVLSWASDNLDLINYLYKDNRPIYLSLGTLSQKKIFDLLDKIENKFNNIRLIHTQLNYNFKDLNLMFINKLKSKTNIPICYGHHAKTTLIPVYMSLALNVHKIFVYIKIDNSKLHPDEDHALYLSEIESFKKDLNLCIDLLGLEKKNSSINYIETINKERKK